MTNQHVPAASTFTTDVHLTMFPLLCPLLYLPFLEQQTRAKQELPETMNDFIIQTVKILYMNIC